MSSGGKRKRDIARYFGAAIIKAIRIYKVVEKDGEILVTGLLCKQGQHVEMIFLIEPSAIPGRPRLTAHQLLCSELIGLWKGRKDIEDTATYARQLRKQAQSREDER